MVARRTHQEKRLDQKTNKILESIKELSTRDQTYPFTRHALAQDQYENLDALDSYEERAKGKRGAVISIFNHMGNASVGHTARTLFNMVSDPQRAEEERLQAAIYLTEIAFLMAEVSGLKRKDIINNMMRFCAQESSLKSIQNIYKEQFIARKQFLDPDVISALKENERT